MLINPFEDLCGTITRLLQARKQFTQRLKAMLKDAGS
jgi:hypothetical protein